MSKKTQEYIIEIPNSDEHYYYSGEGNPQDSSVIDRDVIRRALSRLGMSEEFIDKNIDMFVVQYDGADGNIGFDDGPQTPCKIGLRVKVPGNPPINEPPINRPPKGRPPTGKEPGGNPPTGGQPGGDPPIGGQPGGDPPKGEQPGEDPPTKKPGEDKSDDKPERPREKVQTMLQQFYGDRKAERDRRVRFSRLKSHIVQKNITTYDKDGNKRDILVHTIEDYPEKQEDLNKLLLRGFQTRLERLSRAVQGDFSAYERTYNSLITKRLPELMERYPELNDESLDANKKEEIKRKIIQDLIDSDNEFIVTNNYTYNALQNTPLNLSTLGRFGEKSVLYPISSEQPLHQRTGLRLVNLASKIRNKSIVPINKGMGTFIVAPIYRLLHGIKKEKNLSVEVDGYTLPDIEDMLVASRNRQKGMYTNKPVHRYNARKDYFIRKIHERESDTGEEVRRTSVSKLIKLAILPRVQAVFNYRKGNVAVLNSGLNDIEEAYNRRQEQVREKEDTIQTHKEKLDFWRKKIDELKNTINEMQASKEKLEEMSKHMPEQINLEIEKSIDELNERIISYNKTIQMIELDTIRLVALIAELEREEIDSLSTDALSMSQHDKANKATITTIVKGVKMATSYLVGKYLLREIISKASAETGRNQLSSGVTVTEEVKLKNTPAPTSTPKNEIPEAELLTEATEVSTDAPTTAPTGTPTTKPTGVPTETPTPDPATFFSRSTNTPTVPKTPKGNSGSIPPWVWFFIPLLEDRLHTQSQDYMNIRNPLDLLRMARKTAKNVVVGKKRNIPASQRSTDPEERNYNFKGTDKMPGLAGFVGRKKGDMRTYDESGFDI